MPDTDLPFRDVLIVGGGPAAISAAIWCSELKLTATIFEKASELGGQLHSIHNPIADYAGVFCRNGPELRHRFIESLSTADHEILTRTDVSGMDEGAMTIILGDDRRCRGRAIIFATGVRRRRLGIDGEDQFAGRGILGSGYGEREAAAGKRVAVTGGGDAAVENALLLSEFAERVILIHRGREFSARKEFSSRLPCLARIEVRTESVVRSFDGNSRLERLMVESVATNTIEPLEIDMALVRIGYEPNSEIVSGKVELDKAGYVMINSRCETSAPGVYAVGDVANPNAPTIAGAVGAGATAAKEIYAFLKDEGQSAAKDR